MTGEPGQHSEQLGTFRDLDELLSQNKGLSLYESYEQGIVLNLYGAYAPETIDDIAIKLSDAAQRTDLPAISMHEELPLIAMPGDSAELIKMRWTISSVLSKNEITLKLEDESPSSDPERLRADLAEECQRIVKDCREYLNDLDDKYRQPNWQNEKALITLYFRGPETPEWLRNLGIEMSTDGSVIKRFADPSKSWRRNNYNDPDHNGNRLYLLDLFCFSKGATIPISHEYMGKSVTKNETLGEYYERMNRDYGDEYDYQDLTIDQQQSLLRLMKRVHPIRFILDD